ncbi:MAG: hypothetical protein AVDCRST_MAG38-413, partial [uncultured Solirubrobacteraceae bacterium]
PDGHPRVDDDRPRRLALHDLPARPLLGRHRRRLHGGHRRGDPVRHARLRPVGARPRRDRPRDRVRRHPRSTARHRRGLAHRRAARAGRVL